MMSRSPYNLLRFYVIYLSSLGDACITLPFHILRYFLHGVRSVALLDTQPDMEHLQTTLPCLL